MPFVILGAAVVAAVLAHNDLPLEWGAVAKALVVGFVIWFIGVLVFYEGR